MYEREGEEGAIVISPRVGMNNSEKVGNHGNRIFTVQLVQLIHRQLVTGYTLLCLPSERY